MTLQAQEQIRVVETLPDGTFIVERNGVQYQAFSGSQVRELQKRQAELKACQADVSQANNAIAQLNNEVVLAKKDVIVANLTAQLKASEATRFEALWHGEQQLRLKADQLNEQANTLIHRGRISTLFDNPYFRLIEKLGTNSLQAWLQSRR